MNKCDYCGRENTDEAAQCRECGTLFISKLGDSQTSKPEESDDPARAAAEKKMLYGALSCFGGLLVTPFSFLSGCHVVLHGGELFFEGLTDPDTKPTSDDLGYEALAYGTKLEMAGRVQEALVIYQSIVEKYPDSCASNDAKKSIDSLQAKLR